MIRVFIADDHAIVRTGLRFALARDPALRIVGEAEEGMGLFKAIAATDPHVLIQDVNMPGVPDPATLVHKLAERYPHLRILVYTAYGDPHLARLLIHAGAAGVVPKDDSNAKLIEAIHAVATGAIWVAPQFIEAVEGLPYEALTARETEVLELLGRGLQPEQIAEQLSISLATVRGHLRNIYPKIGANSMIEAALYAARWRGVRPILQ